MNVKPETDPKETLESSLKGANEAMDEMLGVAEPKSDIALPDKDLVSADGSKIILPFKAGEHPQKVLIEVDIAKTGSFTVTAKYRPNFMPRWNKAGRSLENLTASEKVAVVIYDRLIKALSRG